MSYLQPTGCCALVQLRSDPGERLVNIIASVKEAKRQTYRAVFVILKKEDESTIPHFQSVGFKEIAKYPRRVGYEQTGLTMWFLNLDDMIDPLKKSVIKKLAKKKTTKKDEPATKQKCNRKPALATHNQQEAV